MPDGATKILKGASIVKGMLVLGVANDINQFATGVESGPKTLLDLGMTLAPFIDPATLPFAIGYQAIDAFGGPAVNLLLDAATPIYAPIHEFNQLPPETQYDFFYDGFVGPD